MTKKLLYPEGIFQTVIGAPPEEGLKSFKTTTQEAENLVRFEYGTTKSTDLFLTASGAGLTYDASGNVTGGTVDAFQIEDLSGAVWMSVDGFTPVSAVAFYNAIKNDGTFDPGGRYQYLVSLLDDATAVTGSEAGDGVEVGAGNDTVSAGAGDDIVFKWKNGNLNFDGGAGSDTLSFNVATGGVYPTPHAAGAIVNLGAGTGTNPYGGTLKLASVENVVGTDKADTLTGSNADNKFGDGIYDIGADTINALGGNDRVELAEGAVGVHADGGAGIDTLAVNLGSSGPASHKLDLTNQANNTGVFKNDVLVNFEIFEQGQGLFGATGQTFTFIDTNDGHTVAALGAISTLTLNGGDDTVTFGYWSPKVTADGGAGSDTLDLGRALPGGANILDLVNQANNTGIFAGSRFAHFEAFTGANVFSVLGVASFVFKGGDLGESVTGTYLADDLSGNGGNDLLDGGRGNDTLSGGKGKDHFRFDALLNPSVPLNNVDTIADFSSKDTIELDNAIFKALSKTGTLKDKFFHEGKKAHDGNDHIIYNAKTGALFYDADGKGDAAQIQFATLAHKPDVGHSDFLVT